MGKPPDRYAVMTVLLSALLLTGAGCSLLPFGGGKPKSSCAAGKPMWETSLYLGLSAPDGAPEGGISREQFDRFLAEEVSPRFGQGYTVMDATGVRAPGGIRAQSEGSRVLVRVHDGSSASGIEIESVRRAWRERFGQQSVLRTDRVVCADF